MAAPLYARYIPPKKNVEIQNEGVETASTKHGEPGLIKSGESPSRKRKRDRRDKAQQELPKRDSENQSSSKEIPTRFSHYNEMRKENAEDLKTTQGTGHKKSKPLEPRESKSDGITEPGTVSNRRPSPKPTKGKKKETEQGPPTTVDNGSSMAKHAGVLSKFEKSMKNQPDEHQVELELETEEQDLHDLVPIPVPEQPVDADVPISISTLPPWMAKPTVIPADHRIPFREFPLGSNLIERLRMNGFDNSLPIQSGLLPLLLPSSSQYPGDLCVSAHTGSGKTLAYVLPMIQSLIDGVETHLRALIVVPTRELVNQVREAVELCSAGTSLRIGLAVGSNSFATEQSMLTGKREKYDPSAYSALKAKFERNIGPEDDEDDEDVHTKMTAHDFFNLVPYHVPEYFWKVDILIATPGRLVEHIQQTRGFSLTFLQWLIIDEADRLLDASFQEWLETLMTAIDRQSLNRSPCPPKIMEFVTLPRPLWIRKIVLSATMTRDLDKLEALRMKNPKLVTIEGAEEANAGDLNVTELPATLSQFGTPVGDGSEKPLYLLVLLQQIFGSEPGLTNEHPEKTMSSVRETSSVGSSSSLSSSDDAESDSSSDSSSEAKESVSSSDLSFEDVPALKKPLSNALIFTSSNESAHRLHRLLILLRPEYESQMSTITKSSASRTTRKTLSSFRASKLRILVATERASRGLDLPNLENVINYDIPHNITSYIHRVGRTARAGRRGSAWTLVAAREGAWFWKDLARNEKIHTTNGGIVRKRLDLSVLGSTVRSRYTGALRELEEDVKSG